MKKIEVNRAKNTITKEDLIFGASNHKKVVNIVDAEDFPDLSGSDDDDKFTAPAKSNANRKQGPKLVKKQQPIKFGHGQEDEWGIQAFNDPQEKKQFGNQKVEYAKKNNDRVQTAGNKPNRR